MTICPKCGAVATIELRSGVNKPYLQISRLVCENGHCEIETRAILDIEKISPRSTVSLLFDLVDWSGELKKMLGRSNTQHNSGRPEKLQG